jgi:hypothetical protein
MDQADQPAMRDNRASKRIGSVAIASPLEVSPPGCKCSPYDPDCKFNEIDIAAIEIDTNIVSSHEILGIGRISDRAQKSEMAPTLDVDVAGRTSGYRALEVGGVTAAYKFTDSSGNVFCYKNLFELRWPSFGRLLLGRPISSGDSGAWVCAQGKTGTEWCGVVVGDDRLQGYAALSENIGNWLKDNGYDLACS